MRRFVGRKSDPANPNGARHAIAGVTDPSGRILGLMPHPERWVEPWQHPDRAARPEDEVPHGRLFFDAWVATA